LATRQGAMSMPAETARWPGRRGEGLLPPEVPADRWWLGRPLAELRWQLELSRLVADPVFHGRDVPRGNGRPVVLAPGFLAGDFTLLVMRDWLRRIGYRPYTCGFVANVDCSNRALERVD
jgi:triacylglycerol lipase